MCYWKKINFIVDLTKEFWNLKHVKIILFALGEIKSSVNHQSWMLFEDIGDVVTQHWRMKQLSF